ncbi:MAG: Zn-ribbon domain-containing protein [Candidatus Woesearchaeota archaeon]
MPHQCVRCGKMYEDASQNILTGCTCGSKLFYYIRADKLAQVQKEKNVEELSQKDRTRIEKDIYDIIGDEINKNNPVVLDIESVKVLKPGKFELDIVALFNSERPLVYQTGDGRYIIDLANSFKRRTKKS